MLVDIVSKNGNLLLNVVQTPEGDLEPDMLKILDEIGVWTAANGEGIYGSRPWKIYGEKPVDKPVKKLGRFDENYGYSSKDIRFTTKGDILYAWCLGKPEEDIMIRSLAKSSKGISNSVAKVSMVGNKAKISWRQNAAGLIIKKPANLPQWQVIGFKIEFRE
jgi:alpha-L-fucosidase